ncbi:hypothetical protein F2P56_010852 [Juglans regia]|uniref:Disease resistance N-terminal domain-containing protein n=2 Tax=Juglans regia TaxID=51240 RepID=A0A833XS30_JUGRE|nr:disease resistance protein RGA2-like [Juglans regia]KAF5470332.1 hypothetical protein F2P56_010852 [Juglans regia]
MRSDGRENKVNEQKERGNIDSERTESFTWLLHLPSRNGGRSSLRPCCGNHRAFGCRGLEKARASLECQDLEKLKNMVTTIQPVLLDAEEQQVRNNAIKVWLEKLTDTFYEADDLLDDFSAEVLQQEIMTRVKKAKKVSIFFSKSNQIAYLLKTGPKIKAIIEKFHLKGTPYRDTSTE